MSFEVSLILLSKNEDPDLILEEDMPLSLKIPRLTNNHHHFLLDCDSRNRETTQIKHYDFSHLVKLKPVQETLSSKGTEDDIKLNVSQDIRDTVKEKISQHKKPKIQRRYKNDRMIGIMNDYHPNHKTFPHGILKSEKTRKYKARISRESSENEIHPPNSEESWSFFNDLD